uniref:Uncharacterized protein n=1 Tax=Anguilla anguilla TaxID=7936 RepID=A0A0E9T0G9_ANGAN
MWCVWSLNNPCNLDETCVPMFVGSLEVVLYQLKIFHIFDCNSSTAWPTFKNPFVTRLHRQSQVFCVIP